MIDAGFVPDNLIEIMWLGQSGFLLRSAASAVAIDPFLSEHEGRLYAPPAVSALGGRLDFLLVTHDHLGAASNPSKNLPDNYDCRAVAHHPTGR